MKTLRLLRYPSILAGALALVASGTSSAQSNVIPGTDVELASVAGLDYLGRTGTFPNGTNALAMATTICNKGTVEVPWLSPMDEDHPMITFMIARESDGRFEQISDWSYVKHGFFALTSSQCDSCSPPGQGGPGDYLGLGCSDTYSVGNNGNNYWLGPPSEIDPWLGGWLSKCSLFDRGEPPVGGMAACDQNRSYTQSMANNLGPVGNRIRVTDADLDVSGADYYFQGYYVVRGEPDIDRDNNMASRPFSPSWDGNEWDISVSGSTQLGTVLTRWSGASIDSNTNPGDGRVYVGVKVTGPVGGLYHYEYAIHNRDNKRGVGEVRFPAPGATIQNEGFHDIDHDALSDWDAQMVGNDFVYTDNTGNLNTLKWNSMYSFWFDTDRPPVSGSVSLVPAGGGAPFEVPSTVPAALATTATYGCSNPAGSLVVSAGSPTLGSTVTLDLDYPAGLLRAGATSVVVQSLAPHGNYPCGGTLPLPSLTGEVLVSFKRKNLLQPSPSGTAWGGPGIPAQVSLDIPNEEALLGEVIYLQGILTNGASAGGGMVKANMRMALTSGVELHIGV